MTSSTCRSASSQSSMRNGRSWSPPDISQYVNETRTRQGTKCRAKRLSLMERELKYTAQGQEIFGGSLLPGLFLMIVVAVGVVVALALLALT